MTPAFIVATHDRAALDMELSLVDLHKVLLGWLIYVAGTTAVYALLFSGQFGQGGRLPAWLIATASVMAVCCVAFLLYWVREVTTGRATQDRIGDVAGFFWIIALTGAVRGDPAPAQALEQSSPQWAPLHYQHWWAVS